MNSSLEYHGPPPRRDHAPNPRPPDPALLGRARRASPDRGRGPDHAAAPGRLRGSGGGKGTDRDRRRTPALHRPAPDRPERGPAPDRDGAGAASGQPGPASRDALRRPVPLRGLRLVEPGTPNLPALVLRPALRKRRAAPPRLRRVEGRAPLGASLARRPRLRREPRQQPGRGAGGGGGPRPPRRQTRGARQTRHPPGGARRGEPVFAPRPPLEAFGAQPRARA